MSTEVELAAQVITLVEALKAQQYFGPYRLHIGPGIDLSAARRVTARLLLDFNWDIELFENDQAPSCSVVVKPRAEVAMSEYERLNLCWGALHRGLIELTTHSDAARRFMCSCGLRWKQTREPEAALVFDPEL